MNLTHNNEPSGLVYKRFAYKIIFHCYKFLLKYPNIELLSETVSLHTDVFCFCINSTEIYCEKWGIVFVVDAFSCGPAGRDVITGSRHTADS